jgi:hypothetical protein
LTASKRLLYPPRRDQPERHPPDSMRASLVARPQPCGAMARLIEQPSDRRLPARRPAGFFVSGDHQ